MGESLIKKHLLNKNWHFIAQNFRSRYGEIDLIFLSPENTLVFIEVKSRTSNSAGNPEDAISQVKLKHIRNTAQFFLIKNPKYKNHLLRVDVAAIENLNSSNPTFRYYQNVY